MRPLSNSYRRVPPSDYDAVKEHLNQFLAAQVIRESSSPYASPIVLVRKKDGSLRMCVDYRQLNDKTRKDAFLLPCIEEPLDALPIGSPPWTWPVGTTRFQLLRRIGPRLHSLLHLVYLKGTACHLDSVTLLVPFND